jgi:hypothetical protein
MGYNNFLKGKVRQAFKAAKDLVKDVTLSTRTATGFDFGAGTATMSATTTKVVKALIVEKSRKTDTSIAAYTELLMVSEDIGDPTIYDTVTIDGIVWNIVPPYKNNGYTITVEIVRGG